VSGERERRYLEHIAESIQLIYEYVRGGRPVFFKHRQVRTRSCGGSRSLRLRPPSSARSSRNRTPDIPWREVYGFRNIAAHAYLDMASSHSL
jgi:uncharacterized protein with HEPN domain